MPNSSGSVISRYTGSITVTDMRGHDMSTSIRAKSAVPTTQLVGALSTAIGNASNGCPSKSAITGGTFLVDEDLTTYDEANAYVENVIVIVLLHNSNPDLNQEVLIPAFDASLLLADRETVDRDNALVIAVADAAMAIANHTGTTPATDYTSWRAFSTIRRTSKSKNAVNRPIPVATEPGTGDNPPEEPGTNP